MRAIRIAQHGGPEVMRLEALPTPSPGRGEALVRVEAAGVNFVDVYRRSGAYAGPLPQGLGSEGAGVVEALGPEADDAGEGVAIGDRVAWAAVPGSYATHVVAPIGGLVAVPRDVDARTAAAAMLQGMTAHYLAHATYALREGDVCLVHAAAGGVGLLLVQLAKKLGARVLGTCGSEEKAKLAREAGADEVVLYRTQDFVAEVKRLTNGAGVQVVYDSVGKETFLRGLDCLAVRGMMVLFGQSSGAVAPFDPQILNQKGSLFVTRPTLGHYTRTRDELLARAGDVLRDAASGALRVRIGATFALGDAADAHRALEGRRTTGKVLLLPGQGQRASAAI
jgi:NADPH2:quinone reductase